MHSNREIDDTLVECLKAAFSHWFPHLRFPLSRIVPVRSCCNSVLSFDHIDGFAMAVCQEYLDSERQDLKRKRMSGSCMDAGRKEDESNRFLWEFLLTKKIAASQAQSLALTASPRLLITCVAVLLGARIVDGITILILTEMTLLAVPCC